MATAVFSVTSRAGSAGSPQPRSVLIASPDPEVRRPLHAAFAGLRWNVREAGGAAEALAELERRLPEALIVDLWLPDLEANEFAELVQATFPDLDLLRSDGHVFTKDARSQHRAELLAGIRIAQQGESATAIRPARSAGSKAYTPSSAAEPSDGVSGAAGRSEIAVSLKRTLPGMIGESAAMQELATLIRLVAPRETTVLIEGPTGSGKELVAQAVHTLSPRAARPLVVLNCAAIPETLLEAELFGHTRGAFTGAVQSRTGRIEAAEGGTLFLDEIGEMPLALQAKMLRFLEYREIQRVGDNSTVRVNVRVVAATHRPLEQRSEEGTFRLDLYHRLAVFPVDVPALSEHMTDLPCLAEHFLDRLRETCGPKRLTPDALEELLGHHWPGNIRELMHVLERAAILSDGAPAIERTHIRIRRRPRA